MRRRRAPLLLSAAAALAIATAACGTAPTPSPAPTTATPPAPTKVPGDVRTPGPEPGTFTTAWGAAWDALPAGFPVPAGAEPASPGDPADGPVSGAFVTNRAPDEVTTLMQNALAAAGYSTNTLSGPAEDGSLVIDSAGGGGDPACRVQTRVRPLGGTTMITVLFAAACPWG